MLARVIVMRMDGSTTTVMETVAEECITEDWNNGRMRELQYILFCT